MDVDATPGREAPDASANAPPNDELSELRTSRRVSQSDSNIRNELARIFGGVDATPPRMLSPPVAAAPPPASLQPPPLQPPPMQPPPMQSPLARPSVATDDLRCLCERIAQKVDSLEENLRRRNAEPPMKRPPTQRASASLHRKRGGGSVRRPMELERLLGSTSR